MIFRNMLLGDHQKETNSHAIIKVSRHKNLACLIVFVLISIICIVCGVVIGYTLRVRNLNAFDELDSNDTTTRAVGLLSELISLDPVGSNMVMNWYIIGDTCFGPEGDIPDTDPGQVIPESCTPVNITFDTNLLRLQGDNWDNELNNDSPNVAIYTWDPKGIADPRSKSLVFRTTSLLFTPKPDSFKSSGEDASLQNYPFDKYQAYIRAYGIDANNATVNLLRVDSTGIAVGFSAVSEENSDAVESDGTIADIITFKRNPLVISYVFIIVIGVWIITLIFVGSACKVLFGYHQPLEALIIPIGTLFAITSLRGSMPGAPAGFGAIIDFVGILPCLAIITLTGVFLFAFLVIAKNIEGAINEEAILLRQKE